jgi:hypothetical protein
MDPGQSRFAVADADRVVEECRRCLGRLRERLGSLQIDLDQSIYFMLERWDRIGDEQVSMRSEVPRHVVGARQLPGKSLGRAIHLTH